MELSDDGLFLRFRLGGFEVVGFVDQDKTFTAGGETDTKLPGKVVISRLWRDKIIGGKFSITEDDRVPGGGGHPLVALSEVTGDVEAV